MSAMIKVIRLLCEPEIDLETKRLRPLFSVREIAEETGLHEDTVRRIDKGESPDAWHFELIRFGIEQVESHFAPAEQVRARWMLEHQLRIGDAEGLKSTICDWEAQRGSQIRIDTDDEPDPVRTEEHAWLVDGYASFLGASHDRSEKAREVKLRRLGEALAAFRRAAAAFGTPIKGETRLKLWEHLYLVVASLMCLKAGFAIYEAKAKAGDPAARDELMTEVRRLCSILFEQHLERLLRQVPIWSYQYQWATALGFAGDDRAGPALMKAIGHYPLLCLFDETVKGLEKPILKSESLGHVARRLETTHREMLKECRSQVNAWRVDKQDGLRGIGALRGRLAGILPPAN